MSLERPWVDPVLGGEDPYSCVCRGGEDDGTGGEPFDIEDVSDVAF
jgi:hypothetical protein